MIVYIWHDFGYKRIREVWSFGFLVNRYWFLVEIFRFLNFEELGKSRSSVKFVIPWKAGIQDSR